jgi:hypothetical protein
VRFFGRESPKEIFGQGRAREQWEVLERLLGDEDRKERRIERKPEFFKPGDYRPDWMKFDWPAQKRKTIGRKGGRSSMSKMEDEDKAKKKNLRIGGNERRCENWRGERWKKRRKEGNNSNGLRK